MLWTAGHSAVVVVVSEVESSNDRLSAAPADEHLAGGLASNQVVAGASVVVPVASGLATASLPVAGAAAGWAATSTDADGTGVVDRPAVGADAGGHRLDSPHE